jgi:internalin A
METDAQPEPITLARPRRRWFQYSTRGLLVMVTTAAVVVWSIVNSPAERQRRAVSAIRAMGGEVEYGRFGSDSEIVRRLLDGETWRERLLPQDWAEEVSGIKLHGSRTNDFSLVHLASFPRLEHLDLTDASVTDAGLVHVRRLTRLRFLRLRGTQMTGTGLADLHELTELQSLDVSNTGVTDDGLVHLGGLSGLEVLNLGGTRVTDAGIIQVQGLTGLELLSLNDTGVTDAKKSELRRALFDCLIGD